MLRGPWRAPPFPHVASDDGSGCWMSVVCATMREGPIRFTDDNVGCHTEVGLMTAHAVLLGDSIFDNESYTGGLPDVASCLRDCGPTGKVTLLARDGATTHELYEQLERVPAGATHFALSVGGNDALMEMDRVVASDSIRTLNEATETIAENYLGAFRAVEEVVGARPLVVCQIYNPRFPDPHLQTIAVTALRCINDVIAQVATASGRPLVDLRHVCTRDADFYNPIEPSHEGGKRIAEALANAFATEGAGIRNGG